MSWCFALPCLALSLSRWRRREMEAPGVFWVASSHVGGRSWSSFRVAVVDDKLDKDAEQENTKSQGGLVEGCECEGAGVWEWCGVDLETRRRRKSKSLSPAALESSERGGIGNWERRPGVNLGLGDAAWGFSVMLQSPQWCPQEGGGGKQWTEPLERPCYRAGHGTAGHGPTTGLCC